MTSKGRAKEDETTSLRVASHESAGTKRGKSQYTLHVMHEGRVVTYPLALGDSLLVGRSSEANVRIDDPNVSRKHARINVGERIVVEDLGSSNGVRVGSQRLARNEKAPLEPGISIEIGTAVLVIQATPNASVPRRLWSHGYFEGRVQDECARAERIGGTFAVVRVHVAKDAEARALDALSRALAPADLLALYGPGEIEALILEKPGTDHGALSTSVIAALREQKVTARAGAAIYPSDSRAGDALLSIAGERLAPSARTPSSDGVTIYGRHLGEHAEVLARIARGDINILVLGETGVGKEIVADMVHRLSPRKDKPFVRLNCGAFTETLLAGELFGYERGAFTGADRAKAGLLESANGGTVFLDEVGELPLALQPKLLRAIEAGEVQRLGALRPKHIDVRFVSATNRDLESESRAGRFRADLYFRLAGFIAQIAPLRARPGEIAELARGFLADAAAAMKTRAPNIHPSAMAMLEAYPWPGNARELRNVMQRALLLSDGAEITTQHLPADRLTMRVAAPSFENEPPSAAGAPHDEERRAVVEALARFGGNQTYAARELGISRGTLLSRMDAFGITRPRKRPPSR